MKNFEVSAIFNEIADLLEIKNENSFRIRAYRKAAQNIESLTQDVEDIAGKGSLEDIPGIGKDLAGKIREIVATGRLKYLERLKKEIPPILLKMTAIPGIGPKTANLLYDKFKLRSIDQLAKLARSHKICALPNIKEKTEENIIRGIELLKRGRERMPLGMALPVAVEIINKLKSLPEVDRINYAGSLRRMKETVRDIDILVTSTKPKRIMDLFISLPRLKEVLAHGDTKSSVLLRDGIQVDLRVVEPDSYGAALLYFTGSKQHNIRLRTIANRMGYKISEYGIFSTTKRGGSASGGREEIRIAGKEEADIYRTLGLSYISPEMREDTGEIETAAKGKLPRLVEMKDILGDLHVHSEWSDGAHSLEDLAEAAKKRGYQYIAITDHTESLRVAGGLNRYELKKKIRAIRQLNKRLKGITLLASAEMDILSDGRLDISDDLLAELDIVVAAIHSGFKQPKEQLTNRIINAMKNKYVHMIAHPTGRLMGVRDAYELDFEEVFKAAKDTNTALEINAFPQRLDLNDISSRRAKELGVTLAIGSDTHVIDQMDNMIFGVSVARRGWLEKKDVLNALPLKELLRRIAK